MALGFAKRRGGEAVKFGFYWNMAEWKAQIVPAPGATLEGDDTAKYVRLPLLVVLVMAPLMGAAYAMFLPFIGFAMVAMFLTGRLKAPKTQMDPPAAEARAKVVVPKVAHTATEVEHKRAA
jgi:hypothetical protein